LSAEDRFISIWILLLLLKIRLKKCEKFPAPVYSSKLDARRQENTEK
jgi:hypothetical protein